MLEAGINRCRVNARRCIDHDETLGSRQRHRGYQRLEIFEYQSAPHYHDDQLGGDRAFDTALAVHGECLAAHKEFAAARNELRSALADLQRVRGIDHWRTRPVRQALLALPAA
jgi:hypothetical protein